MGDYQHLIVERHGPVGWLINNRPDQLNAMNARMRDEFGGPIPCGGFALIGDEAVGKVVIESIGKSPAVLLKNHGVFTIGKDAKAAVKAAVMTEDNARTVWLAMQIGTPDEISAEDVEKLHHRYMHVYGQ